MVHDVEIRQLRALQAVARTGSFGRAAEQLGFTQSAVSQQIAALERAIGEKVFDRPGGPRPVELTPAGEMLLVHADAVLDRLREAEDGLRSLRAGEVGRLVVGSYQSVSVKVLPDVIGRLRLERPGLAIRAFESDHNDELIQRLIDGELDLSFLVGVPETDDLDSTVLCVDQFVLVSPAGEHRNNVPLADLAAAPLIGQHPSGCQLHLDNALLRAGVEPDYVFRTNDNAAVQAMVRAGMGRAVLPYLAIDPHDPNVTLSRLEPPIEPRVIVLARKRGRTLSPAADRFIELAAEVCAGLTGFDDLVDASARAAAN